MSLRDEMIAEKDSLVTRLTRERDALLSLHVSPGVYFHPDGTHGPGWWWEIADTSRNGFEFTREAAVAKLWAELGVEVVAAQSAALAPRPVIDWDRKEMPYGDYVGRPPDS